MRRSLVFLICLLGCLLTRSVIAADRPNFLFILTDDQAQGTLGAYGNTVCQTPNIDRIAEQGILISDAHHMGSWSGAVCLPSRTMIMTGRTVWRIPRRNSRDPFFGKYDAKEVAENSMGAIFRRAGYDTFRTCKNGNTFKEANAKFEMRSAEGDKRGPESSDRHRENAFKFLKKRDIEGKEKPFLMFLGFAHPHDPRNGKAELLDKYGAINTKEPPTTVNPKAPPLPNNWLPKHPFPHGHPNLRDEVKVEGVMTSRTEATIRNETGREYACIENIDRQIGLVIKKLEASGELANTYVIFTSDHGMAVGRHGLTGKQNLYEHTWKVPFLASGPGIKPGSKASGFIYLLDVLPTLCDLAGIEKPEGVEGVSVRSVLEGKTNRIRENVYGVYCGGTKPGMRSFKTADGWKLIKYDTLDGSVRKTQLFNLNENPYEFLKEHSADEVIALTKHTPKSHQINLADDATHQAKRKELEALLLAEMQRLDDPYRLWDQPQLESAETGSKKQ